MEQLFPAVTGKHNFNKLDVEAEEEHRDKVFMKKQTTLWTEHLQTIV